MIVIPKEIAKIERELDNAAAEMLEQRAITDYNIMMGTLEDPSEDDEEGEEDE